MSTISPLNMLSDPHPTLPRKSGARAGEGVRGSTERALGENVVKRFANGNAA